MDPSLSRLAHPREWAVFRALVFDFDGVIIDTETVAYEAWREVFGRYGVSLGLDEFARCIGTRNAIDWSELLSAKTGRHDLPGDAELRGIKQQVQADAVERLEPLPGVVALIEAALAEGVACAIASSSERSWIVPQLERLGLIDAFTVLSTWEGEHCGFPPKPAPHLYELACAALDVEAATALAIEDSPNGVAAAKAAGLYCLAVPNPTTRALDLSRADRVVATLDAVAPRNLLNGAGE
jgi:HAD superfamily hydrolase (TIGR01509 family)